MIKIGDFSRLSRVPVKALRYYDEIGLLKPTGIDRFTRYRYYSAGQLPVLNRILALKELGFSLEQVARLLTEDLTPDQLKGMLLLKRAEIEQQLEASNLSRSSTFTSPSSKHKNPGCLAAVAAKHPGKKQKHL